MGAADQFLQIVEAVHGAALEPARWSEALEAFGVAAGARAVTLDTFRVADMRHVGFHSWNMRPQTEREYLSRDASQNARVRYAMQNPHKAMFHDGDLFEDERAIDREFFYAEFLAHHDTRYFAGHAVLREPERRTFLAIMHSPRQGPVEHDGLRLLQRAVPHVRTALSVQARLATAERRAEAAMGALEHLRDGAALIDAQGAVVSANAAFEALASGDGLRLRGRALEFSAPEARRAFEAALGAALRLTDGEPCSSGGDFVIARPGGGAPLSASLRPVFRGEYDRMGEGAAVLFLHDPDLQSTADQRALAETFGFTAAEVRLAMALRAGVSPSVYADERGLSINTVYTHLSRLKDKTGVRRLASLVHRLKDAAPASLRG